MFGFVKLSETRHSLHNLWALLMVVIRQIQQIITNVRIIDFIQKSPQSSREMDFVNRMFRICYLTQMPLQQALVVRIGGFFRLIKRAIIPCAL
jgi:hypothetical protein